MAEETPSWALKGEMKFSSQTTGEKVFQAQVAVPTKTQQLQSVGFK